MTAEEELAQLRAEKNVWREIAHEKHQEAQQLQQEKQVLRDGLKEAIQAIERLQEHASNLEGQIGVLQEGVCGVMEQKSGLRERSKTGI